MSGTDKPNNICLSVEEIIRLIEGEVVQGIELDFNDSVDPHRLSILDDAVQTRIEDLYGDDEDDE
jgi:hypothetical protein